MPELLHKNKLTKVYPVDVLFPVSSWFMLIFEGFMDAVSFTAIATTWQNHF